jgi:hypothetical protein
MIMMYAEHTLEGSMSCGGLGADSAKGIHLGGLASRILHVATGSKGNQRRLDKMNKLRMPPW